MLSSLYLRKQFLSPSRTEMCTPEPSVMRDRSKIRAAVPPEWKKIGQLGNSATDGRSVHCIWGMCTCVQNDFHDVDSVSPWWICQKSVYWLRRSQNIYFCSFIWYSRFLISCRLWWWVSWWILIPNYHQTHRGIYWKLMWFARQTCLHAQVPWWELGSFFSHFTALIDMP